jgi:SMI1 / KNR4 family (SUKH-1)
MYRSGNMPGDFDWRAFLEEFSEQLLEAEAIRSRLPDEMVGSGWMGFGGASEDEIRALEERLGVRLPPSYRRFLSVSNGWRSLGINEPGLNPMSKVEWYREHHQKVIEVWQTGERRASKKGVLPISDEKYFIYGEGQATYTMRSEYLHFVLWISDGTDEADYLLNPKVIFPDGEWEAWKFAHWYPGAVRTRSFREMMEECLRSLRLVRDG